MRSARVAALSMLLWLAACIPADDVPSPTFTLTPVTNAPATGAAPDPTSVALIAAVQIAGQPEIYRYEASDNQGSVDLLRIHCVSINAEESYAYETVTITQREGDAVVVDSELINCGGLGAYGFQGMFWSPNGRYFYYHTARMGVPDGCGNTQPTIQRLNAATLEIHELGGGWVAPDHTLIATWDDGQVTLWDVNDASSNQVTVVDAAAPVVALAWSSDSRHLIYLQTPPPCAAGTSGRSTVARVDLPDMEQHVLLTTEAQHFVSLQWDGADDLLLYDTTKRAWRLNLETGELVP